MVDYFLNSLSPLLLLLLLLLSLSSSFVIHLMTLSVTWTTQPISIIAHKPNDRITNFGRLKSEAKCRHLHGGTEENYIYLRSG
jgi:hypothetical protein